MCELVNSALEILPRWGFVILGCNSILHTKQGHLRENSFKPHWPPTSVRALVWEREPEESVRNAPDFNAPARKLSVTAAAPASDEPREENEFVVVAPRREPDDPWQRRIFNAPAANNILDGSGRGRRRTAGRPHACPRREPNCGRSRYTFRRDASRDASPWSRKSRDPGQPRWMGRCGYRSFLGTGYFWNIFSTALLT